MSTSLLPMYVPILKWRQGEYQSLLRLADEHKERLVPLLELCPPEFDFETEELKKTIDAQLSTFALRFKAKWGARFAFVDGLHLDAGDRMADGGHPLTYVLDDVRVKGGNAIPVTGLERDLEYQAAVRSACAQDQHGACVRLSLEDVTDTYFGARLDGLLALLGVPITNADLVIDLKAANFEPIAELSKLILVALRSSPSFSAARSVTIAGASFPASMGSVPKELSEIKRLEWLLYKAIISGLTPQERRPFFGDYAIAAPDLSALDMRFVKPAATVRYAIQDAWLIAKGKNVRDYGFGQYEKLCEKVTKSPYYLDAKFSKGSEYVAKCAVGTAPTGNLTTWRWVGTNHHMTKVVDDLANFSAPSA